MFDSMTRKATWRVLTIAATMATMAMIALSGCKQKMDTKSAAPGPVAASIAGSPAPAAVVGGPLKIGFVYGGLIGDGGSTYAHDLGRKALEAQFGDKIKTTFVENVADAATAERVLRDLAAQGNTLIFGTNAVFLESMLKVAKDFPAVKFEDAGGTTMADNVGVYDARSYEGAYLSGLLAGAMSKSGKLGVVASTATADIFRDVNAFALGAQSSNAKASTRVVWINKGFDPAKEREAALGLIQQGADVLLQTTDSPAPLQAAEEKGMRAIGWFSDMSKFGPKAQLVSATINWAPCYTRIVSDLLAGNWKSEDISVGSKEEVIVMISLNPDVPATLKAAFDEKSAAIKAGSLQPFQGPISDQAGKKVVAAGKVLEAKDLRSMNFYVKGIDGVVPK